MKALLLVLLLIPSLACAQNTPGAETNPFAQSLVDAALERATHSVTYDGAYRAIPYPGGDVPDLVGVCTDVIIRSYRALGFDFQKAVHEDMLANFGQYPKTWGAKKPDPNIDHRRVPNLQTYLERKGASLPISQKASDYHPGELVTYMLPGNLPHIAIVVPPIAGSTTPAIVHNIGAGPRLEARLFDYPITGHYRYEPEGWSH